MAFILPIANPEGMEISIHVDISDDFLSTKEFDDSLVGAIKDMANEAKDFWKSEAGRRLKSSRQAYQDAVKVGVTAENSFSLQLDGGFLPSAIETGTPAYSLNIPKGAIVPLNIDRDVPFLNPKVFRTSNGQWTHKGFPGMNIASTVVSELDNSIISKHIWKALEEL